MLDKELRRFFCIGFGGFCFCCGHGFPEILQSEPGSGIFL